MNPNAQSTFLPGRTRYASSRSRRQLKTVVAERIAAVKHLGWDLGVVIMERVSGHRREGGALDVHLASSARDLVAQKSKAVRGEMEWLAQAIQNTGSYVAKDEAARALHAVMDALGERVPPDVMLKLCEHLPQTEADRLRVVVEERRRAQA
jgi:hypothetical protein